MPQLKAPGKNPDKIGPGSYYKPLEVKDMYYNMNRRYRGLALILNHENFDNGFPSRRRGTKQDRDRLQIILKSLGFKVEVKNEMTYKEIFNIIYAVSKLNHSHNDCLLIAVLTHGELGMLHARDTTYKLRNLWEPFTDKNCPTLAGKPKIFFIQACRGGKYDNGITLSIDGPSALTENPTHPDFVFGFSTVPGYYSWRNRSDGSWFIQALCDILADCAIDTDILTMLTFVSHKVALDFESYTPNDLESHEKKEMPSIHSTLTRLLIFNNVKKRNDCCNQS